MFVAQLFIAELFAGKVKNAVTYHIVAVVIAAAAKYAVNLSAENILGKECGYRALPQSFVILRPLVPEPWCAGVCAPYAAQDIVKHSWVFYRLVFIICGRNICPFPAVKFIFHIILS